jgi:hypothetical protein
LNKIDGEYMRWFHSPPPKETVEQAEFTINARVTEEKLRKPFKFHGAICNIITEIERV